MESMVPGLRKTRPMREHSKREAPLNGKGPSAPKMMSTAPAAEAAEVPMMTVCHGTPTMTCGKAEPTQRAPTIAPDQGRDHV